jgi:hypothetical protein
MNQAMNQISTNATGTDMSQLDQRERQVLSEVLQAIRSVRHGYVQITLQDARVVQIDTLEKKRLDR